MSVVLTVVCCLVCLLQVKQQYKEKYWDKIDRDLAVQLGCLDIRSVELFSEILNQWF